MRFGIDATGWSNQRGFGRFTRNAVARLVEIDLDADYVVLVDRATPREALPARAKIRLLRSRRPPNESARAGSSRGIAELARAARTARQDRLDAFLFPSLHTWFPAPGAPAVVGVHDTISADLPELAFPSRRDRTLWRLKQRLALRSAHSVFTVSEAARAAICRQLGLPSEAIAVVPEAPDPVFAPRAPAEIAEARGEIGVPERYLLYAGGISPHKNVTGLVDAYAAVLGGLESPPALVLVGSLEDETFASSANDVRKRIASHGLDGRVFLPGFVPDETLARLYSGATVVVNASLGEGFGLPAVEAAACGAALVLSDLPAHRETLGDAALYVSPGDTQALASALGKVLEDAGMRESLGKRAAAAVASRTWNAAADVLARLLREAARQ